MLRMKEQNNQNKNNKKEKQLPFADRHAGQS